MVSTLDHLEALSLTRWTDTLDLLPRLPADYWQIVFATGFDRHEIAEEETMNVLGKGLRLRRALLLVTGQTTSYGSGSGVDDGALQKGEAERYTVLTSGQYSGSVNITINGKTDAHSNACVVDELTGLMWSRTVSAGVGPTSNGSLPWTTNGSGEGIFPYVAAANAANLAGYSDWRVPNKNEAGSLQRMEGGSGNPDATAFPTGWNVNTWSSTTTPSVTANAIAPNFVTGVLAATAKTTTAFVPLVRGPIQ